MDTEKQSIDHIKFGFNIFNSIKKNNCNNEDNRYCHLSVLFSASSAGINFFSTKATDWKLR